MWDKTYKYTIGSVRVLGARARRARGVGGFRRFGDQGRFLAICPSCPNSYATLSFQTGVFARDLIDLQLWREQKILARKLTMRSNTPD